MKYFNVYYIIYHKKLNLGLSYTIQVMIMKKNKVRRIRYRLSIVFFGTVIIFGLMFYKYMKSTTLEDVLSKERTITVFSENTVQKNDNGGADEAADDDGKSLETGANEITNPVPESDPKDDSYLESCVFIGDNITFGLVSYNILPKDNVLASPDLSLSKIDTMEIETSVGNMTVLEAVTEINPENIYIMLGSNGAAYMSPDELYMNYAAFLNKLRIACPEAKLYVISTPPVSEVKENSLESPIKNSDLDDLNSRLLEYCNKNSVYYLDLSSALKDSDGRLPADCAENDGMHFTESTYKTFISYVLNHTVG